MRTTLLTSFGKFIAACGLQPEAAVYDPRTFPSVVAVNHRTTDRRKGLRWLPKYLFLLGFFFTGAMLSADPSAAPSPTPIITALLPGNIGYWRIASFTPETSWTDLGAQLGQWTQQGAEGIILDLRSDVAPNDYAGAARVAEFFTPAQTLLFSLVSEAGATGGDQTFRSSASGPLFHQPIVILINPQTGGAAEALAACLKAQGALVVGRNTHVEAADFAEQKRSTNQVRLADGTDLGNHPVTPDISLTVNDQAEKAALDLIAQHAVLDVIREAAERHRMSEAALVRGDDPEWDDYLAAHEKKPEPTHPDAPLVQDAALVVALDSLKAIQVSQQRPVSSAGETAVPGGATALQ